MRIAVTEIKNILTRTSGFLKTVSSHSAQPYRGCAFGKSLCGVGCYVRHNGWVTEGRTWGDFLDVRLNAAESYLRQHAREKRWARRSRGAFSIFLSSSTEPFQPQEFRWGVTRSLLEAMLALPPDELIVQTHTHLALRRQPLLKKLSAVCRLRLHLSIESDLERLPSLPPPASSVDRRFEAARRFKESGIPTVITVAPLFPMRDPEAFFQKVSVCADAVVIDHFIAGDGTPDGSRTLKTDLPQAMKRADPRSVSLAYRDEIVAVAERWLPGRVGVNIDGFAGRYRKTLRSPRRK